MSTAGGVWKALERGRSVGCDVVQIFVKSNMQWFGKEPSQADVEHFRDLRLKLGFTSVFGHAGYLINLGAPAGPNRDKSIQSLIQEIEFASTLELPFLVLHPGAHLGQGEPIGLRQVATGLNEVIQATYRSNVRLALENTAGQGSCLGYRLQHLAELFNLVSHPERLGVCLDTAHFFAAGYDIRTPVGWKRTIEEVDHLLGLRQILAFHLNDSKTDLASRVDRHEHIGQGKIGQMAFGHIVRDSRFKETPGCLETPKSADLHEDLKNLARLRSMEAKKGSARRARNHCAPRHKKA